jgi:hypothetical protein
MAKTWLIVLVILLRFTVRESSAAEPTARLMRVDRIWNAAPHNAFTDLIHWHGRLVCAFREGRGHVSADGKIRVLTSVDGAAWAPAALIELDGYDLRDAGLSITAEKSAGGRRLMLIGGASPRLADGAGAPTGSFVSFSDDAETWTTPAIIVEPGRWLWRVTWQDGKAYGVSYAAGAADRSTTLFVSDTGKQFHELVPNLLGDGYPTEATLRFDDRDTLYCLQRRDGKPPANTAMLGISRPPYSEWTWHDLGIFFGGPNFIRLPSGHWIAAGRIVSADGPKTELAWLDVEKKSLRPILQLPSGGDTSYPGLVWNSANSVEPHHGVLWMSYYSSHEGKANIYLAKVRIK